MLFIWHFSCDQVQIKELLILHFFPLFFPTILSKFEIYICALKYWNQLLFFIGFHFLCITRDGSGTGIHDVLVNKILVFRVTLEVW